MAKIPFFTGCHEHRLDAYRRLRLPTAWSTGSAQVWLLFPRHLLPPCNQVFRSLYLLPVDERLLSNMRTALRVRAAGTVTPEVVLDSLRSQARQHALDPKVATVIRTTPTTFRFTLTQAQLDWLGCRGRTLVLIGSLNTARLYTPAGWAEIERAALRRTKQRTHSYRSN